MKINFVKKTNHSILFREIGVGTCFALDAEHYCHQGINVNIYMELPHCIPLDSEGGYDPNELINAVNLNDCSSRFIEEDTKIVLIPASLNAEAL